LVEVSNAVVGDGPYCNGYQSRCVPLYHRALGVVVSTFCHDIAPFADPAAPARLAGSQIGFDAAYGRSHNVVAKTDCMLNSRNAWVDNPAMDLADADCFAGARVAWDLR
jgi:hypothetical protein